VKSRKLEFLRKAMEGDTWTLEDNPAQLVEFFNSSTDIRFSTGNSACVLIGKAKKEYRRGEVEAVFQLNEGACLTLGEGEDDTMLLTRAFKDEYLKLRTPLVEELLHLTDRVKCINEELPGGEVPSDDCLCPDCQKKQERIKYNPRLHPLFLVLQNIAYSKSEFVFQFLGAKHRGISYFSPNAMRTHEGWCHLYSSECEIQINLTCVFSIRVEQEKFDGMDHSVLTGRDHESLPIFRITTKGR